MEAFAQPESDVEGQRVIPVVVNVPVLDAIAAATCRIDRGDSDMLAADCRPIAHAVADALVAAGLGRGR